MKRKTILPALALVLLLTACGGNGPAVFSADDAQTLLDAGLFSGEMEQVDSYIVSMLYGIPEEDMSDCVCYMAINTSVSADEVTVLVLTDEAAAKTALEACRKRIQDQTASYGLYGPDQVPRLEDAVVRQAGNTVLLAVGDPDRLSGAVDELLK